MANSDSFFNEIYGTYFNVVSSILRQAQEKQLTKDSLELLVREQAFADSCLTIPKELQDGSWPLLQQDMTTPLRHAPAMPLTTLQRRWLKSLLTDKRIQLFDVDCSGLEDVEPLFSEEQFVYFDRYSDGDDYADPQYKKHFRLLLQAITEKRRVEISFISGKNESVRKEYLPLQLEYSAKDDKFRLKAVCERHLHYVNVGRIKSCRLLEQTGEEACMLLEPERCAVTVLLTDERNALERAMLHFSHLEKITERLDEKHYRLQLMYNKSDETEMVIRILSFGPLLRVQEPSGIIELLRHRLSKQLALLADK
ncbi:WYL domain-containing protein [Phascolarctobacterium succinatutens]|uniref:WYL domain-containing protein n=1 Tax=Phascolarctobacterium succinatutens TaxID=626940 RepID=UPI004024FF01